MDAEPDGRDNSDPDDNRKHTVHLLSFITDCDLSHASFIILTDCALAGTYSPFGRPQMR